MQSVYINFVYLFWYLSDQLFGIYFFFHLHDEAIYVRVTPTDKNNDERHHTTDRKTCTTSAPSHTKHVKRTKISQISLVCGTFPKLFICGIWKKKMHVGGDIGNVCFYNFMKMNIFNLL